MKNIIIDLDSTITDGSTSDYSLVGVNEEVVTKLHEYKTMGFNIVIHTARNMRTYEGNVGLINIHTLPKIIQWLDKNLVPYDEIIVGKPWCGFEGFYVDDRSIRPAEFTSHSLAEIYRVIERDKKCL